MLILNIFRSKSEFGDKTTPGLLLLKEDGISMDRSFRGQPHWLFNEDNLPQFRTLILNTGINFFEKYDRSEINHYNIYPISKEELYCHSSKHPVQKKINDAIYKLLKLFTLY